MDNAENVIGQCRFTVDHHIGFGQQWIAWVLLWSAAKTVFGRVDIKPVILDNVKDGQAWCCFVWILTLDEVDLKSCRCDDRFVLLHRFLDHGVIGCLDFRVIRVVLHDLKFIGDAFSKLT